MSKCNLTNKEISALVKQSIILNKKAEAGLLPLIKQKLGTLQPTSQNAETDEVTKEIYAITSRLFKNISLQDIYITLYNDNIELQQENNQEEENKVAEVEGEQINDFDPFYSLYGTAYSIGEKAKKSFTVSITQSSIYNPRVKVPISDLETINTNIYYYQKSLYNDIKKYFDTYMKDEDINFGSDVRQFNIIKGKLYKLLVKGISGSTLTFYDNSPLVEYQMFIKAFNAFNILNNFDTLLQKEFGNNIEINYPNQFVNPLDHSKDKDKYRFITTNALMSHWRTNEDIDVHAETDKITLNIIESIPLYNINGDRIVDTYLTFGQYTNLLLKLRNLPKSIKDLEVLEILENLIKNSKIPENIRDQYKEYKEYLNSNNIKTIGDILLFSRIGFPKKDWKIFYDLLYIVCKNNGNRLHGLNNIEVNHFYSLYKAIFKNGNSSEGYSLYDQYKEYQKFDNNYYQFILQHIQTITPTNFIQYYGHDEEGLIIRDMYLTASDKNRTSKEHSLSSTYSRKLFGNSHYKQLQKKFNVKYTNEKDSILTYIIPNLNIQVTLNIKTGKYTLKTDVNIENISGEELYSIFDSITDFGDIYKELKNITLNGELYKEKNLKSDLITFYTHLIANIYFSNNADYTSKSTFQKSVESFYGEELGKNIKYDNRVQSATIIPKNYISTFKYLVEAQTIKRGLFARSTVKDSEGNDLGIANMSRLYEGIGTQLKFINSRENSALKDMSIVSDNLVEDVLVAREINKQKKVIDLTPNESYYLSLIVDYLGQDDYIYINPFVIADKSVSLRGKVSKTKIDEIFGKIVENSEEYKEYVNKQAENAEKYSIKDFLNNLPDGHKFKINLLNKIHYLIRKELGTLYTNILSNSSKKWDKLFDFINSQKKIYPGRFNSLNDFSSLSTDYYNSFQAYINAVEGVVTDSEGNIIKQTSPQDFLRKWIGIYQKENPHTDLVFRENIDYVVKNGKFYTNRLLVAKVLRYNPNHNLQIKSSERGADGKLRIFNNYVIYENYEDFVQEKEYKLLQDLVNNNFQIDTTRVKKYPGIKELMKPGWEDTKTKTIILAKAISKSGTEDIINIRTKKDLDSVDLNNYSIELHPTIREHNWMDYFVSQEMLINHMGITEINPTKTSKKSYGDPTVVMHEREEESEVYTVHTKRNVTESANMNLYMAGFNNGLPTRIKVACVEDDTTPVFNYAGDGANGDQKATTTDGQISVCGAYWYLQNGSLGGAAAGPTQKSLWHTMDPETGAVTIVKSACFPLNNYNCRRSVRNKNLIMKMYSAVNWSAFHDIGIEENNWQIYYKNANGQYIKRKLTGFEGRIYIFDEYQVDEKGENPILIKSDSMSVSNNWDLFNLFGGFDAVSFNQEGILSQEPAYNDISQKQLAQVMSTNEDIKNSTIGYIISNSSMKKGIGNTNGKSAYDDSTKLNYLHLELGYFGIQLDKTHEAEGAHLNILTQVMNALASRGYTGYQAEELQNALYQISMEELEPFEETFNNILGSKNTKGVVASIIAKKLMNDDGNDILHAVVTDLTQLAIKGVDLTKSDINLPISLPSIYNKLISTVSSSLSKIAIRIQFNGILAVLTPSHNIYKIFNGKQLSDFNNYEQLVEEERNASTIPVHKLSVGTKYKKFSPDGQTYVEVMINTPDDYWKEQARYAASYNSEHPELNVIYKEALYSTIESTDADGNTTTKIIPEGRNLEPYNAYFTINGVHYSMWDLESVHNMWETQKDIDRAKKEKRGNDVSLLKQRLKELREQYQEDLHAINNGYSVNVLGYRGLDIEGNIVYNVISGKARNISVKPYENIMPNLFVKEFGLTKGTKIHEVSSEYFLNQLLSTYESNIPSQYYDIEIKQNNGEHIYIKHIDGNYEGLVRDTSVYQKIRDSKNKVWVTDIKGNKLYQLSSESDEIYTYNHQRIIVTDNINFYSELHKDKIQVISDSVIDSDKLSEIFEYMNDSFKESHRNESGINKESLKDLNTPVHNTYIYNKLQSLANEMYNSFILSLNTIAARIPSQSMQSVMAMTTVGFDETGINNVYVSPWQLWLQGSDYDIDCASMLSYSFSQGGHFTHWSPLAIVNQSYEQFKESLYLPLPSGNKIKIGTLTSNSELNQLLEKYVNAESLIGKGNIIREINKLPIPLLADSKYSKAIKEINKHNLYFQTLKKKGLDITDSVKNFISFNMFDIIANPVNNIQAQSSIDQAVEAYKDRAKDTEKAKIRDRNQPGNVYNKGLELSTNMTGKAVIGITAAGMKALLSITHSTNHALNTLNPNEIVYVTFDTSINGITYTIAGNSFSQTVNKKRFDFKKRKLEINESNLSDIEKAIEQKRIDNEEEEFNNLAASAIVEASKSKNDEDILLVLSALLSLATDSPIFKIC